MHRLRTTFILKKISFSERIFGNTYLINMGFRMGKSKWMDGLLFIFICEYNTHKMINSPRQKLPNDVSLDSFFNFSHFFYWYSVERLEINFFDLTFWLWIFFAAVISHWSIMKVIAVTLTYEEHQEISLSS